MSYDYVLRLQAVDGYRDLFTSVFSTARFPRALCVQHFGRKGDNPHYHFCLTCDYKKDALRKHLKNSFKEGKGNKHISLKDWDGQDQACSYLFHEGTEPIMSNGFTIEQIDEFKKLNKAVQEQIKKNAPAKIVQDATEFFKKRYLLKDIHQIHMEREIFVWIMIRLKQNGDWIPNKFQMTRWSDRVLANILSDNDWGDFLNFKFQEYYSGSLNASDLIKEFS